VTVVGCLDAGALVAEDVDAFGEVEPPPMTQDDGEEATALLRARKAALRQATSSARAGLGPADRAVASAAAEERLWRLPELRSARTIALYTPHGAEVDLTGLAARCRARGRRTALPRVTRDELVLVATTEAEELFPGFRGIAEPTGPPIDPDEVDAIVVPGLAFDPHGGRLGRGGGHYDRLLARLPAAAVRIGVGFACQLVPNVPREAHDEALDLVVTDRAVHRAPVRTPSGR
jgi:5-formyltetrahydrofolate cyclo-ligase